MNGKGSYLVGLVVYLLLLHTFKQVTKPMYTLKLSLLITACCLLQLVSRAQVRAEATFTDSLQHALLKENNDTAKIVILYQLANAFAYNDSAIALKYAKDCLRYAQQKNWQKGVGLAYRALGTVYYNLSDYSTSIEYFKKGLVIFQTLGDKKNAGRLLSNIGDDYGGVGLYVQSLDHYWAALKLFEEINYTIGISAEYNNIGIDYYNLLQYDKAIENYTKALQVDKNFNDKFSIASGLDNIADVYYDEHKYDSANAYNTRAVTLFEEVNDQAAIARAYINRGNILLKQDDAVSAYDYYNRALSINKKINITTGIASCYRAIGDIYLTLAGDSAQAYTTTPFLRLSKRDMLVKAKEFSLQALQTGKQVHDMARLMNYNLQLSTIEEKLANYKNALAYHQQYTAYKDSIFNDANRKKVEALEQERIAEVKNQQIQLLQQQKALDALAFERKSLVKNITLLAVVVTAILVVVFIILYNRRKKIQFEKQVMEVEMKALRAQMNPHFIFNSLHSINNYVMENDKQNASKYLLKFASLMRFILENSREQEVAVETDLQALELYMQLEALQSKQHFTYHINIDDQIDKVNTIIPPMLLQPFVENAILHGLQQKEDGRIDIKISKQDEMICFEIEDNGTGIKEPVVGHPTAKHKSLARKIVDERLHIINHLQQAKASVSISTVLGDGNTVKGAKVKLLLPLKQAF